MVLSTPHAADRAVRLQVRRLSSELFSIDAIEAPIEIFEGSLFVPHIKEFCVDPERDSEAVWELVEDNLENFSSARSFREAGTHRCALKRKLVGVTH